MKIYTIGFTGKTAGEFFEKLKGAGVKRLVDIRLNNTSQLAAFAKKNDLEYFLKEILGAEYVHLTLLAPPEELLKKYKADKDWDYFETTYNNALEKRRLAETLDRVIFDRDVVLLCSEETAEKCHRRLAADALAKLLEADGIEHL